MEIGCGSGYVITSLARILEKFATRGCHLVATDISPAALTATAATLQAHSVLVTQGQGCSETEVSLSEIIFICCDSHSGKILAVEFISHPDSQAALSCEVVQADLLDCILPRLYKRVDLLVRRC